MADDSRTEQATPRRRQKAREKGQIARSREISGALAMLGAVMTIGWQASSWSESWKGLLRGALNGATTGELTPQSAALHLTVVTILRWVGPALALTWGLAVFGSVGQGFVFSAQNLGLKWERLNPASNLQKLFSPAGLGNMLKSLVPMSVIAYIALSVISRDWDRLLGAVRVGGRGPLAWMFGVVFELSWKACLVFLAWSLVDYMLQKFNFSKQLRMTKQEIREEMKETEGNPTSKGRVRRLQRQMSRRLMLKRIERATVVITNPTHYAVALEYRPAEMAAPLVVAKGRNLLAERIKEEARRHGVAIVENPPLAQALYRAVEIGQSIPPKLYRAVAEILAFIFRAQTRAGTASRRAPVSAAMARAPIT
ncbi:MAG TPA: EscU/YscU/HrcU family type III secretion system export apparatus switch protein [Terriglobia bacterium]|nr:EscU/YscU/HrcU family type III secretion system export apparatus switch protein [Terriglobia bacterium]